MNQSTHPVSSKKTKLPSTIINIQSHIEKTFELWNIQKPNIKTRLYRSTIFVSCLIIIVFWPWNDLMTNFLILSLSWIILSIKPKPISYWLLMLNMQFNIAWIYSFVNHILLQIT